MTILVVGEIQKGQIREASLELVAFAKKIGGDVKGLLIGSGIAAAAEDFAKRGAGHVYVADDAAVANYNVDGWTRAIRAAVQAAGAKTVLISNTPSGWDCAARVAAALDAGFVSDAFNYADGAFVRRVFNGKLDARIVSSAALTVVTVQPGANKPFEGSADGKTEKLAVDLSGLKAKFVETKIAAAKGHDLTKAEIIVSGGRGVGAPEKFAEVIKPLADALGGQMGASRPVVDAGWLPHEYQVGSSGQIVTPKLYVACGISGAIQHLVGMKGANYIIAINKDPDAPIFEVAQLGVVGDLFEIVPKLTAAVNAAKG
jgi:electron transfer flavoprotein alpha subunit